MVDSTLEGDRNGGNDFNFEDVLFKLALVTGQLRTLEATGDSPKNFLYDRAESVTDSVGDNTYVDVSFRGEVYENQRVTWGPLDGDKDKETVLIKANDGKWYKLWFFTKDVVPNDKNPRRNPPNQIDLKYPRFPG